MPPLLLHLSVKPEPAVRVAQVCQVDANGDYSCSGAADLSRQCKLSPYSMEQMLNLIALLKTTRKREFTKFYVAIFDVAEVVK
jgi:hypothetical protein